MKTYINDKNLISTALFIILSACSDQTQFIERTVGFQGEEFENGEARVAGDSYSGDAVVEASTEATSELPSDLGTEATVEDDKGASGGSTVGDIPNQNAGQNQNPVVMKPNTNTGLFSLCADMPKNAIVAQVYPLQVNTNNLPDFASLTPVGEDICLEQLNISKRAFTEGFPEVEQLIEWFGLDINFKVEVPASGTYTFTLSSDDGSLLFIDNNSVINNDGLHEVKEKSAAVYLTKGSHTVHIKYFQGPRYHIALELFWKVPGAASRSYIPTALMSRP